MTVYLKILRYMKGLITRVGNHEIVNDGDFKYVVKKDESKGMLVPVTIYADDTSSFKNGVG